MANGKYDKYIVTELKPVSTNVGGRPDFKPDEIQFVIALSNAIVKGASYIESAWIFPGNLKRGEADVGPHKHDFDEILAMFGSNTEDVHDLGGEMLLTLGGEEHIMNKSFIAFIPAGLEHGPMKWLSMKRPVFHFTAGNTTEYH